MKPLVVCLAVLLLFGLQPFPAVGTAERDPGSGVTAHFFWAENCPHCSEEKSFLDALEKKYPGMQVRSYQVWNNLENFELLKSVSARFGHTSFGTPATVVDGRIWYGYSGTVAREIEETLQKCLAEGCRDSLEPATSLEPAGGKEGKFSLTLPILGKLDPEQFSLPVLTVLIGLLDSFNPCAFFVLFFLLGLLIHARSRGLMLMVGGTFVLFSGVIYFLFMAAWLNLFLLFGQIGLITTLAGILALGMAAVNIKDFFFFHQGFSLSIPDQAKPRLFQRMRRLVRTTRVSSVLLGTAVLAIAANSYELLCTAGFPMVYTRILTFHDLGALQRYVFLVFYNLIYVLPLLAIVLLFTATLGTRKMTEWQGRLLKLISGLMMLFLGGILLIEPTWLNSPLIAVGLLLLALGLSLGIGAVVRFRSGQAQRQK
jgi:thiol-disulfide isomerase/thioredoxin